MKYFCFTVDDNIRFLKELTEGSYGSLFDHPYLAMYKRLHELFGLKIQLNLFYSMDGFDLSMMSEKYANQWREVSDWLKLSFHSKLENVRPYEGSGYAEVFKDASDVHREIIRFAGASSLAETTTVHFCKTTVEGNSALRDLGVRGLLGLYGTQREKRISYSLPDDAADAVRLGKTVEVGGITHGAIDVIVNLYDTATAVEKLQTLIGREQIRLMMHEQYFYPDYPRYQSEFEYKLYMSFSLLKEKGYESKFFEEMI